MQKVEINPNIINSISQVLNKEPKSVDNSYSWALTNSNLSQQLFLNLLDGVDLGDSKGTLVSVQTQHGYFELHNCSEIKFLETEEIMFLNETDKYINTLVIGATGTCSMFTRVNKSLLTKDIVEIEPSVLLSFMQLSLVNTIDV